MMPLVRHEISIPHSLCGVWREDVPDFDDLVFLRDRAAEAAGLAEAGVLDLLVAELLQERVS